MKLFICCLLLLGIGVLGKERVKRQATYTFPGPRSERGHGRQAAAAGYRTSQPQNVYVDEDDDDAELYQVTRRQYQPPPQYVPSQARSPAPVAPAPPPPQPVYEPPPRAAAPEPRQQSYSAPPKRRASSSSRGRANKYGSAPQQSLNGHAEEDEIDQGPDPLTLLLQDSQFSCGGKTDGYYADDSVNCQVFHYCVGGAKHSWMCPENTVFHQVHLNCVPEGQDICAQSQKFHFVNDYLYKPVDYQGPNNTARYSQRYYPDGYVVGDPLVAPNEHRRPETPPANYAVAAAPAPRPPPRQVAPPPPPPPPSPPAYRAPSQSSGYSQAAPARSSSRPSRPVESYPEEGYRGSSAPSQAPQSYRGGSSSQPSRPYRAPPQSGYSEDNLYQPQPIPQSRRPSSSPPQRTSSGYAPPRSQHRATSARSAGAYPSYGSNQAAGVQYDEDY